MYDYDDTPFGRDGDHCPWCGHDWKQPHDIDCHARRNCKYPPGCTEQVAPGRQLCPHHHDAISQLLGPRT